jgi:TRAP-type C4-dicarboxylate transport system permease large subunit
MSKEGISKFFNEFFVPILILILTIWAYVWLKNHDSEWQEEQLIINECLESNIDKKLCLIKKTIIS